MSTQQRRKYDPESKRNAVLLTEEPGRTVREVAENLGISSELIYRWRRQMRDRGGELTFPGDGNMALTEVGEEICTGRQGGVITSKWTSHVTRQRKKYSAEFKAKVALEALAGELTLAEISSKYGVHSTMITKWKKQAMGGAVDSFSRERKERSD